MEKNSSFPPVSLDKVSKKIGDILLFDEMMKQWLQINPNNPRLRISECYRKLAPQINEVRQQGIELSQRRLNALQSCYEKHAHIIRESVYPGKEGQSVVEYEFAKRIEKKRNWLGIVVSKKTISPREENRKEIIELEKKFRQESDTLSAKVISFAPCYVNSKDVPDDKVLPTHMISILKGFIISPDWDKGGIIRDLKDGKK